MMKFAQSLPDDAENLWLSQVDRFVEDHKNRLAALCWGLQQEWGETSQDILGIDLNPTPHFIRCSRESLETLNQKVEQKIQEILGILDGCNPEEEVTMIALGSGQIKLIYFKMPISRAVCLQETTQDLDSLIQELEGKMLSYFVRIEES